MIRRPPRSTRKESSAASDVYKRQVECYEDDNLIGGLYGLHIGSCFFGESMFSLKTNTSKFCLLYLLAILKKIIFPF